MMQIQISFLILLKVVLKIRFMMKIAHFMVILTFVTLNGIVTNAQLTAERSHKSADFEKSPPLIKFEFKHLFNFGKILKNFRSASVDDENYVKSGNNLKKVIPTNH